MKGFGDLALAMSPYTPGRAELAIAGAKEVAAGLALATLGNLLSGGGLAGAKSGGGGGGGHGKGKTPGANEYTPPKASTVVIDMGRYRKGDIITDIPGYTAALLGEMSNAFRNDVSVEFV
jgi:hypothetical protein